jgi:hypothetical protein
MLNLKKLLIMPDIIRLYQEALALLRLRNQDIRYITGDYSFKEDGTVSFVLSYIGADGEKAKKIEFEPMKNTDKALMYFINCAQNIHRLR